RLSKLKIAGYLVAIFLAGGVTGALVMAGVAKYRVRQQMKPDVMARRWCGELESSLNLTPEQIQKVQPIVDDTLNQIPIAMAWALATTVSNGNARIAELLTPEQKVKFQQMIKEREDMMRRQLEQKPSTKNP